MAMPLAELLKLRALAEIPEEQVRAKTEANWFLNDMDEKDYIDQNIPALLFYLVLWYTCPVDRSSNPVGGKPFAEDNPSAPLL